MTGIYNRWIDIENELKKYAEIILNGIISDNVNKEIAKGITRNTNIPFRELYFNLDYQKEIKEAADKFKEEFNLLNQSLAQYLEKETDLNNESIKKGINYESHANQYLLFLKKEFFAIDHSSGNYIKQIVDFEIITFNYTNQRILNHLLDSNHVYSPNTQLNSNRYNVQIAKDNIKSIHGALDSKDPVLGIESNAALPNSFNFLKKGLQYHYSRNINIENALRKHDIIHFYGLSMGETDAPYFRQFFGAYSNPINPFENSKSMEPKIIKIFHFGEEGYSQLINRFDDLTGKNVDRLRQYNTIEFIDISKYDYKKIKSDANIFGF